MKVFALLLLFSSSLEPEPVGRVADRSVGRSVGRRTFLADLVLVPEYSNIRFQPQELPLGPSACLLD